MQIQPTLIAFMSQMMPLSETTLAAINDRFQRYAFSKGEFMVEQGKVSQHYLFLEEGYLRAYLHDTEGQEVTVNFYTPGQVVFEVASFFQRIPAQENIQALTAGTCYRISFEALNALFHQIPEFRELGRLLLVRGFSALKVRMLSMINQTAEQRYQVLLKSAPDLFQHAPLKHIASYLGITDTSLSRIRKETLKK